MGDLDFYFKDKEFLEPGVLVRFLIKEISEEELMNFRPFNTWLAA